MTHTYRERDTHSERETHTERDTQIQTETHTRQTGRQIYSLANIQNVISTLKTFFNWLTSFFRKLLQHLYLTLKFPSNLTHFWYFWIREFHLELFHKQVGNQCLTLKGQLAKYDLEIVLTKTAKLFLRFLMVQTSYFAVYLKRSDMSLDKLIMTYGM